MEEWIQNKTNYPSVLDTNFYQSLPFVILSGNLCIGQRLHHQFPKETVETILFQVDKLFMYNSIWKFADLLVKTNILHLSLLEMC